MCEVLSKALGPRPNRPDGLFIAHQITQAITSGLLPIGTKLSQQSIANHYGISRMPVREALRCVQAKGLINHVPNHTSEVVATTASDETELEKSQAREVMLQAKLDRAVRLLERCQPCLDRPNDSLAPLVAAFLATAGNPQEGAH